MIALQCELIPDSKGKGAVVYFNGLAPVDLSYKKPIDLSYKKPIEGTTQIDGTSRKKYKR